MRTVLTIAGSDSSAGAGLQADLKTFAAFGVYGVCAATAITAQSTIGVESVLPLAADIVTGQIETLAGDITVHATRTGMLATAAIVEAVVAAIEALELPLVVVDPVIRSTSGRSLLDDDGVKALREELLPLARVITPNIPEAEALSGVRISSTEHVRTAARKIQELGVNAVVITGGHAAGDTVVDVMLDGDDLREFRTPRVGGRAHGTGCTFASAVASLLARGEPLDAACQQAQEYVAGALRNSLAPGRGERVLDHFWKLNPVY